MSRFEPLHREDVATMVAFLQVAKDYCDFIENIETEYSQPYFYERLFRLLFRLAGRSETLFDICAFTVELKPQEDKEFHELRVNTKETQDISRRLHTQLKPDLDAAKVELEESGENDEGHRIWMLWDDLVDLYRDLRSAERVWNLGSDIARVDAAWDLNWGLANHWGRHLVLSLRTVQLLHFEMHKP